jgi:serine/threonine protein kinase
MSTYISEPGTRLGGRYRLEDRTAAAGGWAVWKAIDEILARPVTVVTFEQGFPRVREVVTAARAAGRLTDARLTQVFDVEDDWDHAYIVAEWAAGDSLDDLLAAGPLDPSRGAMIVAEAAAALSVAHAAGLAHLCLQPGSLRWTPNSGVKIVGLGVDAALTGVTSEDPAADDTRGLASLLYAALTGHWPGPDCPSLPPAPSADGRARRPRQITAGVPAVLDDITCRALFQQDRRGAAALSTPGELADELAAAIPPPPPPEAAPPQAGRPTRSYQASTVPGRVGYEPGGPPTGWDNRPTARQPARQRPSRNLIAIGTVLALVVVAAVIVGTIMFRPSHSHQLPSSVQSPSSPSTQAAEALKPIGAQGVSEPSTKAALAIDGSPATAWSTQYYLGNPKFGGLKNGSGLLLDMGKTVKLSSVSVMFGPSPGADVAIKVGDSADAVDSFTTVAQQTGLPGGTTTFDVHSGASGRYVLIWFTKLPPKSSGGPSGSFGASIFNVIVKGSS